MTVNVSLKELVERGAHFGHQVKRWNPKMREYIYAVRDGVHIFDLTKTKPLLEDALNELTKLSSEGKSILFVGTKKQAKDKVRSVAKETGSFYMTERWLGGTISNFDQIQSSARKLVDMKAKMVKGEYSAYTKKERLLLDREIARLERYFAGVVGLDKTPDALFVIDIKKEFGAIREATNKGVEVIAIVDSNSDPLAVDFPIPMNDDATKVLDYVLDLAEEAILEGKKIGDKKAAKAEIKEQKKNAKAKEEK
jgi:small subunit ribosomal protein S2